MFLFLFLFMFIFVCIGYDYLWGMCMRMYMYVRACVMRRVCVLGFVCSVFVFMPVFGIVGSWFHHVLPSKRHLSPWTVVCPYRACIGKCTCKNPQNVKSQKSVLYFVKTVMQFAQFSTWCVLCPVEIHNRVSSGERLSQKEMSCCETGLRFALLGPLRKMHLRQITEL